MFNRPKSFVVLTAILLLFTKPVYADFDHSNDYFNGVVTANSLYIHSIHESDCPENKWMMLHLGTMGVIEYMASSLNLETVTSSPSELRVASISIKIDDDIEPLVIGSPGESGKVTYNEALDRYEQSISLDLRSSREKLRTAKKITVKIWLDHPVHISYTFDIPSEIVAEWRKTAEVSAASARGEYYKEQ